MKQEVGGNESRNAAVTERAGLPATDIEHLLHWAYGVQRVGYIEDRGVGLFAPEAAASSREWYGVSGCGCYQVGRILALGARVQTSGVTGSAPDVADGALAVHNAVKTALTGLERGLVIRNAEAGTRPEWRAVPFRCLPVTVRRRGEDVPDVVYSDRGRRPLYCPVRYRGHTAETIEQHRAVYRCWRYALIAVKDSLRAQGVRVQGALPTGPVAPAEPWAHERIAFAGKV